MTVAPRFDGTRGDGAQADSADATAAAANDAGVGTAAAATGSRNSTAAQAGGGLKIAFSDLKLVTGATTRLDGVSGVVLPGRFTAIIGGSGAGKTSLMNVLLARESASAGSVAFYAQARTIESATDSHRGPEAASPQGPHPSDRHRATGEAGAALSASALRRAVGFVPQVDVMRRDMTVRQVLMHSARMRLPQSVSADEAAARVETVIATLGLEHIRHTAIGGDGTSAAGARWRRSGSTCSLLCRSPALTFAAVARCLRCRRQAAGPDGGHPRGGGGSGVASSGGISPGDRKLVNVGIELVAEPRLLCLDEPTTGVDASTAMRLARTVGSLCRTTGMSALAVLHQPRGEIYSLIDDIIVLVPGGRVAYAGSAAGAVAYFAGLGYHCPDGLPARCRVGRGPAARYHTAAAGNRGTGSGCWRSMWR